jgi:hypothetical protein
MIVPRTFVLHYSGGSELTGTNDRPSNRPITSIARVRVSSLRPIAAHALSSVGHWQPGPARRRGVVAIMTRHRGHPPSALTEVSCRAPARGRARPAGTPDSELKKTRNGSTQAAAAPLIGPSDSHVRWKGPARRQHARGSRRPGDDESLTAPAGTPVPA